MTKEIKHMSKITLIRTIYVYLFSLVGLVLMIIAGVRFIDMGLKAWVFTEADNYAYYDYARPMVLDAEGKAVAEELSKEEQEAAHKKQIARERQRDASNSLAMLIVGAPLYVYHWRLAGKKREEE